MIIKKSQLKLVDPSSITAPEPFDFSSADGVMFSNILYDRMKELGGIGLSANQVGVNLSVFVMGSPNSRVDVFNPKIIKYSDEQVTLDEGCLSYPGLYLKVTRPVSVTVEFYDNKGELIQRELTGLTARVFQHEYEHMLGKTFKSSVSSLKWDLATKKKDKKTKKIIRKHVNQALKEIQ